MMRVALRSAVGCMYTAAAHLEQHIFDELLQRGALQLSEAEVPQQHPSAGEAAAVVEHGVKSRGRDSDWEGITSECFVCPRWQQISSVSLCGKPATVETPEAPATAILRHGAAYIIVW